jgi:signal transduction histidine kinase
MKIRLATQDEPLRLALAFMIIALLVPLAVMIWLFQRSVQTERSLAQQERVAAYRQQFVSNARERSLAWNAYIDALPWDDGTGAAVLEWMDRGGIDAVLLVDASGKLLFPPLPQTPAEAGLADCSAAAGPSADPARPDNGWRERLRQTEQAEPSSPERNRLLAHWETVFTGPGAARAQLAPRQRAFIAERLLQLAPAADDLSPALRAALLLERYRGKLQEELVRFYYLQDWSLPDNAERWLYFMRPSVGIGEESIVNYIKAIAGGALVLQTREEVFGKWLEPLWQFDRATSPYWVRLVSPSGWVFPDGAPKHAEAAAFFDLPAPFYRWSLHFGLIEEHLQSWSSRRQTALSMYAAVAILLLVLLSSLLAVRQLGRQIRLNRLKNDFIGMVSHELRTPLASMRMLVDTLIEGRIKDEGAAREYLALIAGENQRLSRLVDNFLTFTRMQRGKNQFQMRRIEPHGIVAAALAATRAHMQDPRVRLTVDVAPDLPPLQGDADALATVIINLLENAYKYTGETKVISLRVWQAARELRIDVEDNGIGIAPREQKLIFREFYQVDNRLARRSEGSGLGLSINRHIIRAHGGRIEVRSKPGAGSRFSVRLPLSASNGVAGAAAPEPS